METSNGMFSEKYIDFEGTVRRFRHCYNSINKTSHLKSPRLNFTNNHKCVTILVYIYS